MTLPELQSLYVMQNEFGLIKIGRSLDPARRRATLQASEQCALKVVVVLEGQGHREEAIHIALADHAIEGEWFEGSPEARAAMLEMIPSLKDCSWPFDHDAGRAEEWLETLYARRDHRSLEKQFGRVLAVHLSDGRAGASADSMLQILLSLSQHFAAPAVWTERDGGESVAFYIPQGSSRPCRIPRYTVDLPAALALWPEEVRPTAWTETAYDCAIAAMKERLTDLKKRRPA